MPAELYVMSDLNNRVGIKAAITNSQKLKAERSFTRLSEPDAICEIQVPSGSPNKKVL
jgi:hypothetical protein